MVEAPASASPPYLVLGSVRDEQGPAGSSFSFPLLILREGKSGSFLISLHRGGVSRSHSSLPSSKHISHFPDVEQQLEQVHGLRSAREEAWAGRSAKVSMDHKELVGFRRKGMKGKALLYSQSPEPCSTLSIMPSWVLACLVSWHLGAPKDCDSLQRKAHAPQTTVRAFM